MNIAFVGLSGVPYSKRASDIRLWSFATMLAKKRNNVFILNKFSRKTRDPENYLNANSQIQIIEDLKYFRNYDGFFFAILNLFSIFSESYQLLKLNKLKGLDVLHVYSGHFLELIKYYFVSRLIGAKVIYQYVEFRSKIPRQGLYHKINGYLFDRFSNLSYDGVISISNYITNHIKSIDSSQDVINVPPICDFRNFVSVKAHKQNGKYILYCGSIGYSDNIQLITDSFFKSDCKDNNICLILILNGSKHELGSIKNKFKEHSNIEILNNLTYKSLIKYYKGALALLIPLKDTIQDIARFPNKICEYSASRGVIVTTGYGEIPYFFKDEENAVIAEDYSLRSYTEKINLVISKKINLNEIKKNSYQTGLEYFNTDSYSDILNEYFYNVVTQ